jgi:tRNA G46 methylase TrmB
MALGGVLEIRSNWLLYLEECQFVLNKLGHSSTLTAINGQIVDFQPLTLFEKKYINSGQTCYRLVAPQYLEDKF